MFEHSSTRSANQTVRLHCSVALYVLIVGHRTVLPQRNFTAEGANAETGIKIQPRQVELDEDGVRISLTVVETPGFAQDLNNEYAYVFHISGKNRSLRRGQSFQEIVGYLDRQYDDILAEESRIKRNPRFRDNRIHALLYFITPTGHSLREMDIELMRRLSPRVNVIPVVGKADSLTMNELKAFKKRVMEDIEHYGIPVYNFPYDVEEDDDETIQDNSELRAMLPFAIVGSAEEVEMNGELVRIRRYPWGVVEVDNPKHSDFGRLRSALLNTHLTVSRRGSSLTSLNSEESVDRTSRRSLKITSSKSPYLQRCPSSDLCSQ